MDDGCRQVLRELELFLDGEDAADLHATMDQHLSDCGPCFDRAEFQREVRLLIASKCTDRAPEGLMERVRSHLWPTV